MKKIILSLLPEKWLNEIYYNGVKDSGGQIVSASYWFSGSPVLYDAIKQIGRGLIDFQHVNPDKIREDIYQNYPDVKSIKHKTKSVKEI